LVWTASAKSLRKSGSRYGLLRDLCSQPCSFPYTT
jgi:hypothetical protein